MCVVHLTNNGEVPHFCDTDTMFEDFVSGGIDKAKGMIGESDGDNRYDRDEQACRNG